MEKNAKIVPVLLVILNGGDVEKSENAVDEWQYSVIALCQQT